MTPAPERLFVAATPGLEPLLAAECAALGLPGRTVTGGVEIEGSAADLRRLCLHSRIASRVLLRIGSFRATSFSELERRVAELAWERFLPEVGGEDRVAVRASARKSRLHHTGGIAERVASGISRRLGRSIVAGRATGDEDDDAVAPSRALVVTLDRDTVRVSLDAGGVALHRRGHRLATAKAPLRETLAAAMLRASGWSGEEPLVDPFCGSGTIVLEAARLARRMAPGIDRSFAFEAWPEHDEQAWRSERARARERELPGLPAGPGSIVGSDRDAGAVASARSNLDRGGVLSDVELVERAVSDARPPDGSHAHGAVVTNPPHGRRVGGGRDLVALHGRFGKVLRERFAGWSVALLTSSVRFQTATRLAVADVLRVRAGGASLRLVLAEARPNAPAGRRGATPSRPPGDAAR